MKKKIHDRAANFAFNDPSVLNKKKYGVYCTNHDESMSRAILSFIYSHGGIPLNERDDTLDSGCRFNVFLNSRSLRHVFDEMKGISPFIKEYKNLGIMRPIHLRKSLSDSWILDEFNSKKSNIEERKLGGAIAFKNRDITFGMGASKLNGNMVFKNNEASDWNEVIEMMSIISEPTRQSLITWVSINHSEEKMLSDKAFVNLVSNMAKNDQIPNDFIPKKNILESPNIFDQFNNRYHALFESTSPSFLNKITRDFAKSTIKNSQLNDGIITALANHPNQKVRQALYDMATKTMIRDSRFSQLGYDVLEKLYNAPNTDRTIHAGIEYLKHRNK